MKLSVAISLFIIILFGISCSNTSSQERNTVKVDQDRFDSLDFSKMNEVQRIEWKKIETDWYNSIVLPLFQKHNIVVDCGLCDGITFLLEFKIDKDKGLAEIEIDTSRFYCSDECSKEIEAETKKYIESIDWDESFTKRHISVRLSRLLKC